VIWRYVFGGVVGDSEKGGGGGTRVAYEIERKRRIMIHNKILPVMCTEEVRANF